jgi:hypothetical protein
MRVFFTRTVRAFALLAVVAAAASAQFTLTTVDGKSVGGAPAGFDAEGRLLWRTGEKTEAYPLAQLVGFEATGNEAPRRDGGVRLELVGGDVLYAALEDGPADELHATTTGFGRLVFSLDDVAVLWNREGRGDAALDLPPAAPDEEDDRLFVERDGRLDSLPGTLERVAKTEAVFSSAAGEKRPFVFARDRVVAVRLASDPKARPGKRNCALVLRDGSRVSGLLEGGPGGALRLKFARGPAATLDLAHLKSATMTGDAFRLLTELTPKSIVARPYLAGGTPPVFSRDRGVRPGEALAIGEERFAKGLLIGARTELLYDASGFSRLTAKIGVDPATKARPLPGSATLIVAVDGAVRWTSPVLRAGAAPTPIDVDVRGGKELKIVVDYADSFDAGARVVLANAMLLK